MLDVLFDWTIVSWLCPAEGFQTRTASAHMALCCGAFCKEWSLRAWCGNDNLHPVAQVSHLRALGGAAIDASADHVPGVSDRLLNKDSRLNSHLSLGILRDSNGLKQAV